GKVEHSAAGICIGDKSLSDRAANPRPDSGFVGWVESGIEAERSIESEGEGILSHLKGLRGRKPPRETLCALSPFGRGISPLPYPGARRRPHKRQGIDQATKSLTGFIRSAERCVQLRSLC